jgi:hypothetical protein
MPVRSLLGWPGFTGLAILVLIAPLNAYLTNKKVKLSRSRLDAKDKRMGPFVMFVLAGTSNTPLLPIAVLNELIAEAKPLKFYAWENKWIARAMETREAELGWFVKRERSIINHEPFLTPLCRTYYRCRVFLPLGLCTGIDLHHLVLGLCVDGS